MYKRQVYTVLSYTFALSVEYNGQMVGFIENETVYENAQNLVQQRLQADADRSEWEGEATFTISVVSEAALSDQAELANRIIATSSQKFVEATGVMVNGTLVGVTQAVSYTHLDVYKRQELLMTSSGVPISSRIQGESATPTMLKRMPHTNARAMDVWTARDTPF